MTNSRLGGEGRARGHGRDVGAVDMGGGWVCGGEEVSDGAGTVADVEEAGGVVKGRVDGVVVVGIYDSPPLNTRITHT